MKTNLQQDFDDTVEVQSLTEACASIGNHPGDNVQHRVNVTQQELK